jgi:hypothetical protein
MLRAAICVGAALISTSPQAATIFQTGNQLFARCGSPANAIEEMVFLGYVLGVADSYNEPMFCLPPTAIAKQVSDISCQYLRTHPEKRHLAGHSLVVDALRTAFPCNGQ